MLNFLFRHPKLSIAGFVGGYGMASFGVPIWIAVAMCIIGGLAMGVYTTFIEVKADMQKAKMQEAIENEKRIRKPRRAKKLAHQRREIS